MRRSALSVLAAPVLALALPAAAAKPKEAPVALPAIPDIAYQKFVLPNGLTVLVHEDHKAPIVAVNIWYHVGSKNEKPGKTGFAHLFEHLMFNGSEHFNDDYFQALERVGATDLNGTTNRDRTNYFQNVPTSALDLVLFLESDRMGHLLAAIDQAKLDEQRGVVQNEKRQGENQPYGVTRQLLTEYTYPKGHPYSWTTIGSMEDLTAASLDDVKEWFKTYYGPNNAVLALAGDIDVATAKAKVEKYFGWMPPGPPIAKLSTWVAKMEDTHRAVVQDRVPQARVYKVWNVPEWGSRDAALLDLATTVLSSGKTSRLYKRLVYDDQSATDVNAFIWDQEIGSQVYVQSTVKPGGDLGAVEKAIDEELARFLKEGPTADELARAKVETFAQLVRGAERIGGFGGKSDILATNMVYGGDPHHYKTYYARMRDASAADVLAAARAWLFDGQFVLEVHPYPQVAAAGADSDRSKLPAAGDPPAPKFPTFETATLANGMKVVFARRDAIPVIEMTLLIDAGYAADQGGIPGTARLAMDMLDEGTRTRSALEISDELARLGAELGTGADLDTCYVTFSALRDNLDPSLALLADVVLNPSFPHADFERLQKQQIARIQREKVTPQQMALRVLPGLMYGPDHAYGIPFTGSGTEAGVAGLKRDQLAAFHGAWFKPNNATMVVVGSTTMAEIKGKLDKLFASWPQGQVPGKKISTVGQRPGVELYLIDRPGSQQSAVFAGHVAPPRNVANNIAITAMNEALGGSFTSRINMNLREEKHWSYGAFSFLADARGQRPFLALSSVQADKTAESVGEIVKEIREITSSRPMTADELAKVQAAQTLSLPGQWETNDAVAASLSEMVRFDLPADYFDTYAAKVRALTLADVTDAATTVLHPDTLIIVVVGDRAKVAEGLGKLGLGPVRLIDADGKALGNV